mgnify:CR=1 FL=1
MNRKYINMALDPVKSRHITEKIKDFFLEILDDLGIDYDNDYYEVDDNGADAIDVLAKKIQDTSAPPKISKEDILTAFIEFREKMHDLKSEYKENKTTNTAKSKKENLSPVPFQCGPKNEKDCNKHSDKCYWDERKGMGCLPNPRVRKWRVSGGGKRKSKRKQSRKSKKRKSKKRKSRKRSKTRRR